MQAIREKEKHGQKQGQPIAADELFNKAVSLDWRWAKRGHSSLFVVQAAIHIATGKVFDSDMKAIQSCVLSVERKRKNTPT